MRAIWSQCGPQHFCSFAQSDSMTVAMKTIVGAICATQIAVLARLEADFVSSHPFPLCLSLYLFSLVDFSLFPALPLPAPDNFPQMAHQKRFIERKYRQELKEMRRERERQEKETDEADECRKWQRLFFGGEGIRRANRVPALQHWGGLSANVAGESRLKGDSTSWWRSCEGLAEMIDCRSSTWTSMRVKLGFFSQCHMFLCCLQL